MATLTENKNFVPEKSAIPNRESMVNSADT